MKFRLVLGLLLFSSCAARGPSPQITAEIAKAEALMAEGCYTCLKESLAIFEKHLQAKRPAPGALEHAFDTAILIAVREKELGIPAKAAMARALLLMTPARQGVLEAANLVIGDTTALDPQQRALVTGRYRPPLEPSNARRRALDPLPQTDLAAKYVALSIDCEQQKLIESVDMLAMTANYSGVPLMLFRLSTCGRPAAPNVAALREFNPRWTDTLYWEGRRELASSLGRAIDFPKAIGLFAQGREAFPESTLLTLAWANTSMAAEEFESALSGYNDVIKVFPTHRDALNGRMQSLSYLLRHQDGIAAATRLLDLGTWHTGDAYYWRAWNSYNIKEYDAAWEDVENAIKGLSNSRVYMLAGLIAYSRHTLPIAVDRFDFAFQIDPSACDATWMSGLASIDLDELAVAAPKFSRGMTCFTSSARALRRDLEDIEDAVAKRATPATAREVRNIERLKRDAENADEKSAQSAFNGAQCYARIGQKTMALSHVDAAIAHPRMREKAEQLKAAIEKLPD